MKKKSRTVVFFSVLFFVLSLMHIFRLGGYRHHIVSILFAGIYLLCGIIIANKWETMSTYHKGGFVAVLSQAIVLLSFKIFAGLNMGSIINNILFILKNVVTPVYFAATKLFHTAEIITPLYGELNVVRFTISEMLALSLLDFVCLFIVGAFVGRIIQSFRRIN